jgi:hypothetical protein
MHPSFRQQLHPSLLSSFSCTIFRTFQYVFRLSENFSPRPYSVSTFTFAASFRPFVSQSLCQPTTTDIHFLDPARHISCSLSRGPCREPPSNTKSRLPRMNPEWDHYPSFIPWRSFPFPCSPYPCSLSPFRLGISHEPSRVSCYASAPDNSVILSLCLNAFYVVFRACRRASVPDNSPIFPSPPRFSVIDSQQFHGFLVYPVYQSFILSFDISTSMVFSVLVNFLPWSSTSLFCR